jgi:hypothetical protein
VIGSLASTPAGLMPGRGEGLQPRRIAAPGAPQNRTCDFHRIRLKPPVARGAPGGSDLRDIVRRAVAEAPDVWDGRQR